MSDITVVVTPPERPNVAVTVPAGASGPPGGTLNFYDPDGQLRAQITSVAGDLWALANAYWDPNLQNFYRIDPTHAAFGWQIQGQGYIPGEAAIGFNVAGGTLWVAQPAAYTLIRNGGLPTNPVYAGTGGWELGHVLTQERQFTVGGGGIEMDGYGTFPYGRVLNNTTGTVLARKLVGMCRNVYTDLAGYDDPTLESWYWGYVEQYDPAQPAPAPTVPGSQHWAVAYLPANTSPTSGVFNEFLSISRAGQVTVANDPVTGGGVATKRYVDGRARGGEAFFTGNGSTTSFFVAHGLGALPSRAHLTPLNQASLGCWYTKDATNLGVNYATAPANGAGLAVSWTVYP